jgi:hypothetical protein
MSRAAFTRAMRSMPSFRSAMDAYVQAFLEQVMVSVACNGAHSLKQRLARWLLMMRDRSDDDVMPIGQSLLAEMLGVQRPYITHAIAGLEGVICQTTACSNVRVSGTKVGLVTAVPPAVAPAPGAQSDPLYNPVQER